MFHHTRDLKVLPFDRDKNTVDLFIDAEFVDDGRSSIQPISLGVVIATSEYLRSFYAVSSDFFKSDEFRAICANEGEANSDWLVDNVFKHFVGSASYIDENTDKLEGRYGSVKELRHIVGFYESSVELDPIQRFPLMGADGKPSNQKFATASYTRVVEVCEIFPKLMEAVHDTLERDPERIRIWTYYGAHDQTLFCALSGGMMKMPDSVFQYNYDLRALSDLFGYDHAEFNPQNPHCAIADALEQYRLTCKLRDWVSKDFPQFVQHPEWFF